MIVFYAKSESDFSHNGLGVLDDYIISPIITEELNGIFKLEFDYPTHAPHGDALTPERIIRCPVPDMQDQLFRISEREAAIGGVFHVVAFHVFYDLAQNLIEDTFIVSKYGDAAMSQLLNATQFSHNFTSSSNIDVINNARMVRLNAAAAILDGGADNSFLSRWGGEIVRDRFHVSMRAVRGSDNGVCIRDKKNLTGYRADVDFGTVCTRILPMGFDGLMLPEKYVDSPRIGDYLAPRIRVVKYEHVKAIKEDDTNPQEDAVPLPEAYAMLRQLAAREFSVNRVDLPACSYSVEFAPLERTEEYKAFAVLEAVNLGDVVRVVHEEDGLDIAARMVSYQYDPLVRAYISVQLGTAAPKFTNTIRDMRAIAVSAVQSAVDGGNLVLPQAGGDRASTFYDAQEPSNPRAGDLWYKQNGDKLELWIYESREGVTQWWPLLSDLTMEEMRQELAAAQAEVDAAKQAAAGAAAAGQAAQMAADQAKLDAQTATDKANQAFDDAAKTINGLAGANLLQTAWQQGSLSTSIGAESNSTAYVRSGWLDVAEGKKYLLQTYEGASSYSVNGTAYLHYYNESKTFLSYATNGSSTTPFTAPANACYLRVRLTTIADPATINCYLLQTEMAGGFTNLATMTSMLKLQATSDTLFVTITETQALIGVPFKVQTWERGSLNTITGEESASNSYLRSGFIAVATGERYISQLRDGTALAMAYFYFSDDAFISYSSTSAAVTIPANCTRMRVRATTTADPDVYDGNVYAATTRQDYTKGTTLYSALLMQKDLINLRVAKNDVVNQINISTEGILISGNKVHITGQTTIDNAVITEAMIANAAITNAKIANLDASKITTGTLAAARIAAASITSDKLTVSNGFITNAMIADATIQSAKIATIDAAKITTGTLNANLIKAGILTDVAGKFSVNMTTGAATLASATITGGSISISGNEETIQIDGGQMRLLDVNKIKRYDIDIYYSGNTPLVYHTTYGAPQYFSYQNTGGSGYVAMRIESDGVYLPSIRSNLTVYGSLTVNGGITGSIAASSITGATWLTSSSALNASNITSGTLSSDRISSLPASKITGAPWLTSVTLPSSPSFSGTVYGNRFCAYQDTQAYQINSYTMLDISSSGNIAVGGGLIGYGYPLNLHGGPYIRFMISGTERAYVSSSGIQNSSLAEQKSDIQQAETALDIIESAQIYRYRYKAPKRARARCTLETQPEAIAEAPEPERLGFVIGEGYEAPPACVLSEAGDAINIYSMAAVCWRGLQELLARVTNLEGA